jgi:hypothetical protein
MPAVVSLGLGHPSSLTDVSMMYTMDSGRPWAPATADWYSKQWDPKANAGTAASHDCYFVFELPVHKSIYL